MVAILLIVLVLGYANAVDADGADRQRAFWGQPTSREVVREVDYVLTPQNVHRFGYRFGGDK